MRFIFGLFIVVLPGSVSGNDGGKACSEEWYLPDAITVSDRTSGWSQRIAGSGADAGAEIAWSSNLITENMTS